MTNAITLAHVSDTHLSRSHAWFTGNWPVFLAEARALRPDMVVHTGDVSFNGPANPDDLVFARRCLDRLEAPVAVIAGNHDIGEAPVASRLAQPINDARLAAWRASFGEPWWSRDLDRGAARLRLIGLDTALMASGHPDEGRQAAFLESALAEREGRTVMLFLHMPPFGDDPEDSAITTDCLLPEPRRWLLDRCVGAGVAAIAAGHMHRYRVQAYRGIAVVTAPATAFVIASEPAPARTRPDRAGYLVWRFDGATVTHELVEPPLFMTLDVGNWIESRGTTTKLPPRPLETLADPSWPVG